MKEEQLAESAKAEVIFATYAMAEEGLDIVGLNTLIFATPKSSITQSIGRILRKQMEEGDVPPLVLDVSDELSSFPYQARKRMKFYEQNKYQVRHYPVHNTEIVSKVEQMSRIEKIPAERIRELYPQFTHTEYDEVPSLTDVVEVDVEELMRELEEQNCSSDLEDEPLGDDVFMLEI